MADKKNIVIKVKYPTSGRKSERPIAATRRVTEWNIKRIVYAAALLVLFPALLLLYWFDDNTQEVSLPPETTVNSLTEENTQTVHPDKTDKDNTTQPLITPQPDSGEIDKTVVKPEIQINKQKQTSNITVKKQPVTVTPKDKAGFQKSVHPKLNKNVRRALLTHEVTGKEPVGEIARIVSVSNKKPLMVYYFTELKGMKDQKIYHEWRRNGAIVARNVLNISADSWRTFSHKLLSSKSEGNWTVKLIDEKGQVLNEKAFKVRLE